MMLQPKAKWKDWLKVLLQDAVYLDQKNLQVKHGKVLLKEKLYQNTALK